jgi:hypothetical protein
LTIPAGTTSNTAGVVPARQKKNSLGSLNQLSSKYRDSIKKTNIILDTSIEKISRNKNQVPIDKKLFNTIIKPQIVTELKSRPFSAVKRHSYINTNTNFNPLAVVPYTQQTKKQNISVNNILKESS